MVEILGKGSFVCHKKTDYQCAGHMIIKGSDNLFVRLAGVLGLNLRLMGRELVFRNTDDCVEHHKE